MNEAPNPFDSFSGADPSPLDAPTSGTPPSLSPAGSAPKASPDGPDEDNPFAGYADNSLQAAPPPSPLESFATNLKHNFGGLYKQGAETADVLRNKATVKRGQEQGVAGPGEGFSGKPTQQEVDQALGDLAVAQADHERYESFHSEGIAGKAAAILGGGLGTLADPLFAVPIAGQIAKGYEATAAGITAVRAITEAATTKEMIGNIAKRAGEFGAIGAGVDAASQGLDNLAGYQQGFDWQRLMFSTALGAGMGASIPATVMLIKGLRGELPHQIDEALEGMAGRVPERPPMEEPGNAGEAGPTAESEGRPLTVPVGNVSREPAPGLAEEMYAPREAGGPSPLAEASPELTQRTAAILREEPALDAPSAYEQAAIERATDDLGLPEIRDTYGNEIYPEPAPEHGGEAAPEGATIARPAGEGEAGRPGTRLRFAGETRRAASGPAPRQPQSLVGFLRAAGGIKDDGGELRARDLHKVFPGLVNNKKGLPLDRAREMAAEAGYLGHDTERAMFETGINDLLEAIDSHPVYSAHDEDQLTAFHAAKDAKEWKAKIAEAAEHIQSENEKLGLGPIKDPELLHDAAILVAEEHLEWDNALERAAIEHERRLQDHGYDVPGEPAPRLGEESDYARGEPEPRGDGRAPEPAGESARNAGADRGRATERTDAGDQHVLPGAERIGQGEEAQRLSDQGLRPNVAQRDTDGLALFNDTSKQGEMFLRRTGGPHGPDSAARRRANRAQLPGEAETAIGPKEAIADSEARELKINDAMRQIAEGLGRRLEMDGRMSAGALGTYKPKDGVLRIRYAGDIEIFAHELGHAIDQMLSANPATRAAWGALRTAKPSELLAMDYNATVTGKAPTLEEGVAEFLRTFATNPAYAQKNAPLTTDAFRAILAKQPDIAGALADTARLSQVESGLNPMQAFSSMIAAGPRFGFEKLSRDLSRYGIVPTMQDYAANIYGGLVRESVHFDRLTQFLRDMRFEKTGRPIEKLSFADDPDHRFRQLPGAMQSATSMIDRGVPLDLTDPINSARSPSLTKAIARALGGSYSRLENDTDPLVVDFNAYLVARRARSEWDLYRAGQIRNQPVRASENETHQAIADFEGKYPQFQQSADDVFAFQRAYLQRKVDKGLISQDTANAYLAARQDHVPLYRDFGDEKAGAQGGAGGFKGLQFGDTKRFQGSTRDIKNVLRSLIEDVGRGERRMAENDVLTAIDDLAREAGELAAPVWEHVPNTDVRANTIDVAEALRGLAREQGLSKAESDLMIADLAPMVGEDMTATVFGREPTAPRGERVMFLYRGGERQAVKLGDNSISKHFYDLMTSMSEPEKDVFLKMVGAVNQSFQTMITHAPRFLLGTYIRDNMTRMFIPRYQGLLGRVPMAQDAVGVYTMLFDRSFYRAYQEGGGIRGGIFSHAANEMSHDALQAAASTSGFLTRTLDELAAENTLGGKASVLARVPASAIQSARNYGEALIDRVRYREGVPAKGWAVLTTPAKMVGDALRLVEMSETASRVGGARLTFDYLKKQGLTDTDALAGALYESRDVLNYNSHGDALRKMARVFPFMQAGITGADRSARGLIGEPLMAAMRAYQRGGMENLDAKDKAILSAAWKNWLYVGAASGVGASIYYPYAHETEFYRRASDYMKRTYFLLQTGTDAEGNPVGLTIHKGYDVPAALMTTSELFAEEMRKHDPISWLKVMSGLKEALPRQFRSATGLLEASPAIKTAFEVATGKRLGMEGAPASNIVPDALKGKPVEKQVTATTSEIAKLIGNQFGVSPMVVDHVIGGMGGTGGQDIRDLSSAVFGNNPLTTPKDALNRFFFGQIYRTAKSDIGSGHDLRDIMARDTGTYQVQSRGYRDALEEGNKSEASAIYNRADDGAKTFMTLQSSAKFKPDDRALHPLQRSSDIANALYGMMRNLGRNEIIVADRSHKRGEEREVIELTQDQSRKLHAQFNGLLAEETRNGLAIAGHPGYEDFSIIDTGDRMKAIREIDPDTADELQERFKRAHVLPAQGVANVWPEVKQRLLRDQGAARLRDLLIKAKGAGVAPAPTVH